MGRKGYTVRNIIAVYINGQRVLHTISCVREINQRVPISFVIPYASLYFKSIMNCGRIMKNGIFARFVKIQKHV
jgi:hypothetical protein